LDDTARQVKEMQKQVKACLFLRFFFSLLIDAFLYGIRACWSVHALRRALGIFAEGSLRAID